MSKKHDDAFGDAVYEAWRAGLNPDAVDRDRVYDDVDYGYDRFEAADNEVARLHRFQRRRREQQEESLNGDEAMA